jgi:hypothetical protein
MTEDELKRKLEDSFRFGIGYCPSVGACASRSVKVFRAAGWSPPVESKLRVVEKCPSIFCENGMFHRTQESMEECLTCHGTGTVFRIPTPEEIMEALELFMHIRCQLHANGELTLSSGAKIILVEDNDANGL